MAGFQVANFDFGQNIENNRIKRQQLAQQAAQANQQAALQARGQDIQRENAAFDRDLRQQQIDEGIRQFDARMDESASSRAESARQFDAKQEQAQKEFESDQKWKKWHAGLVERTEALGEKMKLQEMEERDLKMQKFMMEMDAYSVAAESERIKTDEMIAQAQQRKELFDSALGKAILAAFKSGGNLFGKQLDVFNNELSGIAPDSSPFDFFGNTITDPKTGQRTTIGDGQTMYMGSFQRNKNNDIVYGNDGTPVVSAQAIPSGIVETVLNSAYGEAYLGTGRTGGSRGVVRGSGSRGGLDFDQRKELDQAKYDSYALKNASSFFEKFMNSAAGTRMFQDAKTMKDVAKLYKTFMSEILGDVVSEGSETSQPSNGGEIVDEAIAGKKITRKPVVRSTESSTRKRTTKSVSVETRNSVEEENRSADKSNGSDIDLNEVLYDLDTPEDEKNRAKTAKKNNEEDKILSDAQKSIDDFDRNEEEVRKRDEFDSKVRKSVEKNKTRSVNRRVESSPIGSKSKGRASHEGVNGSFSSGMAKAKFEIDKDDDLRTRRLKELHEQYIEERDAWNKGGQKGPFKFSGSKEWDELVSSIKKASDIIGEYKAERQLKDLKNDPDRYNLPILRFDKKEYEDLSRNP